MVDSYGTFAPHGGGAFSGKDATKVDRSAAYMARFIAKNIVAAGFAQRCQVTLAYAIGEKEPVMVDVNTFGTGGPCEDDCLSAAVRKAYDPVSYTHLGDFQQRYKALRRYHRHGQIFGRFVAGVANHNPLIACTEGVLVLSLSQFRLDSACNVGALVVDVAVDLVGFRVIADIPQHIPDAVSYTHLDVYKRQVVLG